ncbi:MAG: ECF-type sigma factor [Planctomycetaceae bacterium]|nr:ECF-type sigma factor [Planctomycetaceae bacterium]
MSDVTRILSQIESGDPQAAEQLLPLVYDELRRLARQKLAHERLLAPLPGSRPRGRGNVPGAMGGKRLGVKDGNWILTRSVSEESASLTLRVSVNSRRSVQ